MLVKGADWGADDIVGRDVVEARGGRVVRMELAPGFSTTALLGQGPRAALTVWDNRGFRAHLRRRPGGLSVCTAEWQPQRRSRFALFSARRPPAPRLDKLAPVTAGLTPAAKALAAVAAARGTPGLTLLVVPTDKDVESARG